MNARVTKKVLNAICEMPGTRIVHRCDGTFSTVNRLHYRQSTVIRAARRVPLNFKPRKWTGFRGGLK